VMRYFALPEEKIVVVPNALGSDFITAAENTVPNQTLIREKYHLPERYILSVGTFQPRKNLPLLIRAFAAVRARVPNVSLVLVGNRAGHHFDQGIDQAREELSLGDAVIFPGYIAEADLPTVMRGASIFVFPSLYEGFGIPLLEAMSQDVPVAASDIPCLREVGSDAVQYFDPRSIASCEEKLYTLLTDMEQRTSGISRGKDRLSLFSWKKSALILDRLYTGLL